MLESEKKKHVVSIRLSADEHRRVATYARERGLSNSAALRQLVVSGLAADGLELYSTELGGFLRRMMAEFIARFDEDLDRRNDQMEDRIARVVARSAKQASVASLICTDLAKGIFPTLKEVPVGRVYEEYSRRAGEMQAGRSFEEALRHGRS